MGGGCEGAGSRDSEGLVMSYSLICAVVTQACSFRENSSHCSFRFVHLSARKSTSLQVLKRPSGLRKLSEDVENS